MIPVEQTYETIEVKIGRKKTDCNLAQAGTYINDGHIPIQLTNVKTIPEGKAFLNRKPTVRFECIQRRSAS